MLYVIMWNIILVSQISHTLLLVSYNVLLLVIRPHQLYAVILLSCLNKCFYYYYEQGYELWGKGPKQMIAYSFCLCPCETSFPFFPVSADISITRFYSSYFSRLMKFLIYCKLLLSRVLYQDHIFKVWLDYDLFRVFVDSWHRDGNKGNEFDR
jgi:hypothetical protein